MPSSCLATAPEEPGAHATKLTSPTTESNPGGGQSSGRSPTASVQYALPTATLQMNMHLHFLPRGPSCKTGRTRPLVQRGVGSRLAVAERPQCTVDARTSNPSPRLHSYLRGAFGVVVSLAGHAAEVEALSVAKVDVSRPRRTADMIVAELEPMLCGYTCVETAGAQKLQSSYFRLQSL